MTNEGWKLENSYSQLPRTFYREQMPTPVRDPEIVMFNGPLAESLGLNAKELNSEDGAEIFAGNQLPEGAEPIAQAYAGHQFANFTMLGDGRAVLLGEQITPDGKLVDIQLKGPGRTPYSRGGDGRASLGPMLREYIISEAMHGLGIPTTRSLAVTTTGEPVYRETELPGAILTRVASSHLRVGTFQYAAQWGTKEDLQALADYAIKRHYPHVENDENRYLSLLKEVVKHQAELIAKWQLVGFIHGVMNTDNMTISGETIDYGPCAFMDTFDPGTVFSSIDIQGRYAYGNQPAIGGWNLARLAESMLTLLADEEEEALQLAQDAIAQYPKLYHTHWLSGMREKIGLYNEETEDKTLIEDLLKLMHKHEADYTNAFRALTLDQLDDKPLFESEEFTQWKENWEARLERQEETKEASQELMRKSNPSVIPRNHRVEEALEAAVEKGDYSVMKKLLQVLTDPYAYSSEQEDYTTLPEPTDVPYQTYCGT
ncbi:protein adenylyltransferase SelO [Falsibacillus albus]|uniref:Protein nucleotidyltransferase YdiU n=1 Tax=Falsibacillus albus TaxID=2478915 RepID=A0A3L7JS33_9BACI|nr:YdiU family protein [Falsibacillus albus]RLQ93667.1 YdiU family protein [Falsibacillus albus]